MNKLLSLLLAALPLADCAQGVDIGTPAFVPANSGVVSTLSGSGAAGSADGPGPAATFTEPFGVADRASNLVGVIRQKAGSRPFSAISGLTPLPSPLRAALATPSTSRRVCFNQYNARPGWSAPAALPLTS